MGFGVRSTGIFMGRRWHGRRGVGHPDFRGSPFFGEGRILDLILHLLVGPVVCQDQFHGIDGRGDAQPAARFVRMGLHGFDADVQCPRRRLGAVVAAYFAQHLALALAEFFDV